MEILCYTKHQDIVPVATLKMLVATCGEWRQGWTMLALERLSQTSYLALLGSLYGAITNCFY